MSFLKPKAPKTDLTTDRTQTETVNSSTAAQGTESGTQESRSFNEAFPLIMGALGPLLDQGSGAFNFLGGLLGLPGGDMEGASAGFEGFKKLGGFNNVLRDMQRGVAGTQSTMGLLNSGSTQKALLREGTKINQGFFNNYLQQLLGFGNQGMGAANLIADTAGRGATSSSDLSRSETGTQSSTGNVVSHEKAVGTGQKPSTLETIGKVASTVGKIASLFPSDRRLKENIDEIERLPDGLGIYRFNYIGDPEMQVGVMADEVEKFRPWALGPVVDGYATVDYEAL